MLLSVRREIVHRLLRSFPSNLLAYCSEARSSVAAGRQSLLAAPMKWRHAEFPMTTSLFIDCSIYHYVVRGVHDCTATPKHRRVVPPLDRTWPVHVFAVRS